MPNRRLEIRRLFLFRLPRLENRQVGIEPFAGHACLPKRVEIGTRQLALKFRPPVATRSSSSVIL